MPEEITLRQLQAYVKAKCAGSEDNAFLFHKLVEEVGEVSRAISNHLPRATEDSIKNTLEEEICDVLFYTLAVKLKIPCVTIYVYAPLYKI